MTNDTVPSCDDEQVGDVGQVDGWLTIYAQTPTVFGDMYWPVKIVDLKPVMKRGYGPHLMMRFNGQISAVTSGPFGPSLISPHENLPLQSTSETDGGSSEPCSFSQNVNVTICFTTGQLKS